MTGALPQDSGWLADADVYSFSDQLTLSGLPVGSFFYR